MARLVILSLALLLPTVAPPADPDAKRLAQAILTKGAALFDTRDAAAMAATYTEDASPAGFRGLHAGLLQSDPVRQQFRTRDRAAFPLLLELG